MKTAEQVLKEHHVYLEDHVLEYTLSAMQEYAKQVAQKALEDASERVKYNVSDFYCDCGQSHAHWTVDKQSILSTPLIIE